MELNTINKEGVIKRCKLSILQETNSVTIVYEDERASLIAVDMFPFMALCKIRKVLEEEQIMILCKGNRYDVYPSGSMLIGFNAYKLTMKSQAREEDIVNIFDEESEVLKLGNVEKQKKYFHDWIKSL